ncbi:MULTISPECIES: hypothetical protein [Thalassolituus]|jgi:hypothetical protein|uniref:Uncharacterized protein n=1 Tax=Thalassolituus maritimus TaxID=484498 RepID=A0A1N7K050_9GAMM|nr:MULTISPECIES: hypothetical protein [Thalassolituus]MEC8907916.1 hypothetical protein [Pseudomonadota bacterium]MEC9256783.1 hypothetical protein [Pseudomonadota bacterium]MEE3160926.1 hypothetical protein [Pseudomonadota bacterium]MEE3191547.1 hypothetical protein [Pseudomonadota bacterium]MEE3209157.1 hypothetical protein [Pseudomonadota bacterium]|tara:strand:- start:4679 stop:4834 length:156 start_codon:yes stop_codon:yes gene_type:complete
MNKQLIIFLLVIGAFVGAMSYYHVSTPSPFDGEAFFGPKETPAPPPETPQE